MERVWIYQSDRQLTTTEEERILEVLDDFTGQWKAHGKRLSAWAEVRYGYFVIITVDEAVATPTGCSIDKSVHLLKDLEGELKITLFDRMQIAYKKEGGEVIVVSRTVFEQLLAEGVISTETIVFNNLVQNRDELASNWEIPLKNSWHSKVFR
ncbi:hypothetical protein SAMN05216436_10240 [bacterium A37T11]|nr:hypothetical protein SAMN05216436_10240 [bacterium A37T11]